jgi:hypothetical protein
MPGRTSRKQDMAGVKEATYKADITAGALKVPESRVVAGLLLQKLDAKGWAGRRRHAERPPGPQPGDGEPAGQTHPGAAGDDGGGPLETGQGRQGQRRHARRPAAAVKGSPLLGDFLDLARPRAAPAVRQDAVEPAVGGLPRRLPGAGLGDAPAGATPPGSGCGRRCSRPSPRPVTSTGRGPCGCKRSTSPSRC